MRSPTDADEVHFARTADGWRLALHRHRPRRGGSGLPVILCPGYGCNRHFIDYDERYSLARFLAARGFDAWVLELRGRGLSHPMPGCARPWRWTFDDLARVDGPAAIARVAEATRRRGAGGGGRDHRRAGRVSDGERHAARAGRAAPPPRARRRHGPPAVGPGCALASRRRVGRARRGHEPRQRRPPRGGARAATRALRRLARQAAPARRLGTGWRVQL